MWLHRSIETLDLSYCENISDNSLSALSRLKRPDGAGLRELYLSGCQGVTGRGISTLMSGAAPSSATSLLPIIAALSLLGYRGNDEVAINP